MCGNCEARCEESKLGEKEEEEYEEYEEEGVMWIYYKGILQFCACGETFERGSPHPLTEGNTTLP